MKSKLFNLKLFAVIVPLICIVQPAGAAELYNKDGNRIALSGSFKVRHYFSDDKGFAGDQSKVKFTLTGDTKINDTLSGYARWEYNVKMNQAETTGTKKDTTRIAFAGLSFGEYGSFDYGRNYGILNDINGWTGAVIPVFGGQSYDNTDNFMTYRTNNVGTYRNRNLFNLVDGLDIGLQVQGKNDGWNNTEDQTGPRTNNPRSVANQNGDGMGLSAVYTLDNGLSFGASYATSKRTDEQQLDHRGKKADGWNAGVKYDANNIYLAAMYADVRNMHYVGRKDGFANQTQAVEFVAQYQFDWGLRPSIAYLQGRGKNLESEFGDNKNMVKFIDLAATYDLNKNMAVIVEYKLNLLKDNEFTRANRISTDDVLVTMLNYRF
ncbi:porin [Yersinia nurmii]|uniref:Porin n=1 Tax=Yersinia nurmii TaxID=685706 RepID=A0AAW7K6T5_9GAMM|nr:porin [Yersinia nurmii]MDN0087249.1 porin [Yersinia nurmii]CNE99115.1 putative outer membrane porin F protein [Yersinia nurmii]